jgi:glycosyltransferase involved in cell wall biosynthesis
MKTRIAHFTTLHPPFDSRIFMKECVSLSQAGYEVFLVVPHTQSIEKEGVHVIALPTTTSRLKKLFITAWQGFFAILKLKVSIVQIHDPELIRFAPLFWLFRKKVIFDSHEYVSKQIESKPLGPLFIRKIIGFAYMCMEQFYILFCARVIVTESGQLLSKTKLAVVKNYPILSLPQIKISEQKGEITRFIYCGGLTEIRGIFECIEAIGEIDNATLTLIGAWDFEAYRQKCMSSNGWKKVTEVGHLPASEVYRYYVNSHVGLAILYPEKNYLDSTPVKVFEYLACGLPVIMSNFTYWKKTFVEGCSFVNPFNQDELVATMKQLQSKSLRIEMGQKGNIWVKENCSWENEARTLVQLYNEISK